MSRFNICTAFHIDRNAPDDLILSHKVYVILGSIFCVLGLAGNSMAVCIFRFSGIPKTSRIFLLILSLSNSTYLIVIVVTRITTRAICLYSPEVKLHPEHFHNFPCKLFSVLLDALPNISTCLLLLITFDRFLAIFFPMRWRLGLHWSKLIIFFTSITVVILAYVITVRVLKVEVNKYYKICSSSPKTPKVTLTLLTVETVVFRVIPLFSMVILNALIAYRISKHSSGLRNRMIVNNQITASQASHISLSLLAVSAFYVIMVLPATIHWVLWTLSSWKVLNMNVLNLWTARNYVYLMQIGGFSGSFYVCVSAGQKYREAVKLCVCHRFPVQRPSSDIQCVSLVTHL